MKNSVYERVRDRYEKYFGGYNMSDKEIIERQEYEIEYYRNKLDTKTKEVYSERNIYSCGVDTGKAKDYAVTRWYEDGILIKEEIKPCI